MIECAPRVDQRWFEGTPHATMINVDAVRSSNFADSLNTAGGILVSEHISSSNSWVEFILDSSTQQVLLPVLPFVRRLAQAHEFECVDQFYTVLFVLLRSSQRFQHQFIHAHGMDILGMFFESVSLILLKIVVS